MEYFDGYVLAVPKAKKDEYLKMAELSAMVFKDHGALRVVETWADDVPEGKQTSFPMAVQCKEDEVVVFSWVAWPSKEAREIGNQKVMEDPRFKWEEMEPVFDGKRMIYGGFQAIVDA